VNRGAKSGRARLRAALLAAGLAFAGASGAAFAQGWPARPIRIVVAYQPGGPADVIGRAIAPRLGERLGQPVAVENRPGASGNLGMEAVVRAAPDGHTLLLGVNALVINPLFYKLSFDPRTDLIAAAPLVEYHLALAANPALGVRGPQELVEKMRREPGRVTCATSGGQTLIACEMLASLAGAQLQMVPYKSISAMRQDLAGGFVDLVFDAPDALAPLVLDGRARVLGIAGPARRDPQLGELASLESVLPGLDLTSWLALMAPARTPAAILRRLAEETAAILQEPAIRQRIADMGGRAITLSPQAFAEYLGRQARRYEALARERGLRGE